MRAFESLMLEAKARLQLEDEKADYWHGYMRGLRRAHHGERFGTDDEHRLWLSLADERFDTFRQQREIGYRAGLAALQ